MGTVLIGQAQGQVDIKECHINLWALPSWPDELYYLDIGLWLANPSNSPVESIRLGIPANVHRSDTECLVSTVTDPTAWHLLFKDCVKIELERNGPHWDRTLVRSDRAFTMTTVSIDPDASVRQPRADFSVWQVTLGKPPPPQGQTYIRARFRIRRSLGGSLAAVNLSKDLGLYERVRTYDIRLNETREQLDLEGILGLFRNRPKIERVFIFLITKQGFTPRVLSPDPRYVRSLEAKGWDGYLGRRLRMLGLGSAPNALIYSWQSNWEQPSDEEFRAFASFHRDLGRLDLPTVSVGAVLSIIAIAVAQPDWINDAADRIIDFAHDSPVLVSSVAVASFVLCLLARFARRAAETLDSLLYRVRLHS